MGDTRRYQRPGRYHLAWPGKHPLHRRVDLRRRLPYPPDEEALPVSTIDDNRIYKICPAALWREAERAGAFMGAPVDHADGFIHFSTAAQLRETARRHFAGQEDLTLVAIDPAALGEALRFEPSRGGDLFPHLYGTLPLSAVRRVAPLPLGPDGAHVFPEEIP
ncbi:hypothetical protein CHELA40_11251 [Chelatococcus asaccharovorans]|nr:hypothetical protein CHELA40_11251 [Chelatococcus asaccharovorans]CAH1685139.1 hypothetical protein CHELA17_64350 [Chelatococcus asaccharovorans]